MNMHWEHLDGGSYMKRRKWALLAVLLGMMVVVSGCFGGGSRVATGGVTGYVYTPNDTKGELLIAKDLVVGLKPFQNARITATGTTQYVLSDKDGRFTLLGIPEGRQIITISHPSYKPRSVTINIIGDQIVPLPDRIDLSGKGYYLLIGVGEGYTESFWHEYERYIGERPGKPEKIYLYAPTKDVSLMYNVLTRDNKLKLGRIQTLINEEAKWTAVLTRLEDFSMEMQDEDYLVIYFSGHGIPNAIALADSLLADGTFRDGMLKDLFARNDVTLILDTCYSGSFADGDILDIPLPAPSKALAGKGYTVIASSRPVEESNVRDPWDPQEPSIFTYYVAEALRQGAADKNSDGMITVQELYNYASPRARMYSIDKYGYDFEQNMYVWPSKSSNVISTYSY
jgi:hypothetical protein